LVLDGDHDSVVALGLGSGVSKEGELGMLLVLVLIY